jgi:hypothetical protein
VIYLTLLMTFAVRALSLFLTVWLTATAAFPPCCWSMASAHDHQTQQEATAGTDQSHDHQHHDSTDSAAPASVPVMSAVPAHDCDTASAEAVATPRTPLSFADLRAMCDSIDIAVPQPSVRFVVHPDYAPPGASSASAFLNPLRI